MGDHSPSPNTPGNSAASEPESPDRLAPGYVRALLKGSAESALFLAPLALLFDLVGYLPSTLRLFCVFFLLTIPACRLPWRTAGLAFAALVASMTVNAVFTLPNPAALLLLVGVHLYIWSLTGFAAASIVRGVACYTVLHLCLFASPLGYPVLEALSAAVRTTNQWITGTTLNVGFTYLNLGSLLLFLCLSIHTWDPTLVSKLRTGAFLVVALLINAFAAALFVYQMNVAPELTWELKFRDPYTIHELAGQLSQLPLLVFPAFLFVGHALAYLFLHHDVRQTSAPPEGAIRPRLSGATIGYTAAGLVVLLLALPPTAMRRPSASHITFLDRGVVSFTKPDYTRFGRAAGGMYGFFPEYAQLFGCTTEVVKEIPDSLQPDQILVMTNIDQPVPAEEFDRIWDFVRGGGKLWVLGDHTFIKNGRNHINDLLAPCTIQFNHDSAQFWPQGWFHSYRMIDGTPFGSLEDPAENRLSLLVGASLDLTSPARPLVLGRFGYGDWGPDEDTEDRGYLGDFEYQNTERCGDLVLVAGESVGKGKVLAFGDTTSFFNANLGRSYEILRASLSWLGEPPPSSFFFSRTAGIILFLALLALLAGSLWTRSTATPVELFLLAAVFAITLRPGLIDIDPNVGRSRLALFDYAHQPYAAKHGSLGNGLYGLSLSFLRHDLLPVTQNRWTPELLNHARILVLNAPRRPFSAARVREIQHFMESGGSVILACGAPQYPNAKALLDPLQLSIRNLPLGRFFDRPAFNQNIQYFSAWPIVVRNPDASVLSLYNDWPLMVDVPVGSGRLVLVADSQFFLNKNLESHEQYSMQNIQFVRNLLDYLSGPVPEPEEAAP